MEGDSSRIVVEQGSSARAARLRRDATVIGIKGDGGKSARGDWGRGGERGERKGRGIESDDASGDQRWRTCGNTSGAPAPQTARTSTMSCPGYGWIVLTPREMHGDASSHAEIRSSPTL